jgi:hypothetical protein
MPLIRSVDAKGCIGRQVKSRWACGGDRAVKAVMEEVALRLDGGQTHIEKLGGRE